MAGGPRFRRHAGRGSRERGRERAGAASRVPSHVSRITGRSGSGERRLGLGGCTRIMDNARTRQGGPDGCDHLPRRRRQLREAVPGGRDPAPRNLPISRQLRRLPAAFRQDSSFLYFTGVSPSGMALRSRRRRSETLYGPAAHPDDLVWFGARPSVAELAEGAGWRGAGRWRSCRPRAIGGRPRRCAPLPAALRADRVLQLAALLGVDCATAGHGGSAPLIRAVVAQRSVKSEAEVAEIEDALDV